MLRLRNFIHKGSAVTLQKIMCYTLYIHLKDHNKKINPKQTKQSLSYMNPKTRSDKICPVQSQNLFTLKPRDQQKLQKKIFEDYKQKILQGKIDEEQQITVDPLWGQEEAPSHFYKFMNSKQIANVSHHQANDINDLREQILTKFFECKNEITSTDNISDINDYAQLSLYYRLHGINERIKWNEIEKAIGNKFHKLTLQSLITLKYACGGQPKQCTPEFHKILKDLLIEQLPNMSPQQLVHLFYANRSQKYRNIGENLQIMLLSQLKNLYKDFKFIQKIDWLLLFTDSRNGLVRTKASDRHLNQKRDLGNKLLYQMNFLNTAEDLEGLNNCTEEYLLKIVYCLGKMRLINISHIVELLTIQCQKLHEEGKLSSNGYSLFFIYFSEIQGGKGITNRQLLSNLQQKVRQSWDQLSKINQLRSLWAMHLQGFYDEASHQLYRSIQMEADNSILGYFSRLEILNSSQRQWQVIHMMAELEEFPVHHFQDYKRFYNSMKATTQWNLGVIRDKLENTEIYIDTRRHQCLSYDKRFYRNLKKYLDFSSSGLPNKFFMGVPIKNTELVEFAFPEFQISFDIATDVQCIPGTQQLKGSALAKIKSLQSLGWKHFYAFQSQIQSMKPLQFFEYIQTSTSQYIQQQKQVLQAADNYRAYQLQLLRNDRFWKQLSGEQVQLWINDPEKAALMQDRQEGDDQQMPQQPDFRKLTE